MQAKIHSVLSVAIALMFMLVCLGAVGENAHHMPGMHMSGQKTSTKAVDIVRDPADVPAPVNGRPPTVVHVTLTAKEVVGRLDPGSGTEYRYWTFNGKVPGPMIRVRQGDTIQVTLNNDPTSHMAHSVDLHAALGPGGGAAFSEALPGKSKTFSFQAATPGLFVYHCGTPMIAEHIANGMYGLILVEPPNGLAHVDHEYYVMQGEVYTEKAKGTAGIQEFNGTKLMQEHPEYFVFNGAVDALTSEHPLKANAGDTVRIFFGDAGPNRPSSLHVVGEIFTKDYIAGSLSSAPENGVQTASVAPGSAAILELQATTPGKFNFMDHAMSRMAKGLMGTIEISGEPNLALMHAGPASDTNSAGVLGTTEADAAAATAPTPVPANSQAAARPDHAGADMPGMSESHAAARKAKASAIRPDSKSKSPTEISGCLEYDTAGVRMKAWPSGIVYRLQAQPLLFAEYTGQLVHLAGHVGSVVPGRPSTPQDPSFVVDTLDPIAHTCKIPMSAALLRSVSAVRGAQGSAVVGMDEMTFTKSTVTIKAGQTVIWKNTSHTPHNVVDDASKALTKTDVRLPVGVKPFGSTYLQPGQSYSHTFTVPGTYRYVCTLHEGVGMKGTVIVKGALPGANIATANRTTIAGQY